MHAHAALRRVARATAAPGMKPYRAACQAWINHMDNGTGDTLAAPPRDTVVTGPAPLPRARRSKPPALKARDGMARRSAWPNAQSVFISVFICGHIAAAFALSYESLLPTSPLRPRLASAATSMRPVPFGGPRSHAASSTSSTRICLARACANGQVEGQINRLKLVKRQMYGRANFDLLRARFLHAA